MSTVTFIGKNYQVKIINLRLQNFIDPNEMQNLKQVNWAKETCVFNEPRKKKIEKNRKLLSNKC